MPVAGSGFFPIPDPGVKKSTESRTGSAKLDSHLTSDLIIENHANLRILVHTSVADPGDYPGSKIPDLHKRI
jgi:hypothetical protein